ncbi:MAG: hypothetical protein EKK54_04575 [Neisseriaceae bacterium]|nr:MAG: hypothetical protein EKK54_04575 [Neisseriaceae bacterium]
MFIKCMNIISSLIIFACGVTACAMFSDNNGSLEKHGMIEKAPLGKYQNESGTVWEEPEFFDNENGTAAEVPM